MIAAIIPARINSKGIKEKNLRKIGGQSLVERAVRSAGTDLIDKIYVSTNSTKIITELASLGDLPEYEILTRPSELAQDHVQTDEVVLYCLRQIEHKGLEVDTVVVLQPPSPFRTVKHVEDALKIYLNVEITLFSAKESHYHYNTELKVEETSAFGSSGGLKFGTWYRLAFPTNHSPVFRLGRQDDRQNLGVLENGAIYITNAERFSEKRSYKDDEMVAFIMDEYSSLDIDAPIDLEVAHIYVLGGLAE